MFPLEMQLPLVVLPRNLSCHLFLPHIRQTSPGYFMIGDIGSGSKFSTVAHVMNYANTSTYKTVLSKHGAENFVGGYVGLWRGNTGSAAQAITSITVGFNSQNIASGTTFTLYGIAAA